MDEVAMINQDQDQDQFTRPNHDLDMVFWFHYEEEVLESNSFKSSNDKTFIDEEEEDDKKENEENNNGEERQAFWELQEELLQVKILHIISHLYLIIIFIS